MRPRRLQDSPSPASPSRAPRSSQKLSRLVGARSMVLRRSAPAPRAGRAAPLLEVPVEGAVAAVFDPRRGVEGPERGGLRAHREGERLALEEVAKAQLVRQVEAGGAPSAGSGESREDHARVA